MKRLPKSSLESFFASVAAAGTLYLPTDGANGKASYTRWTPGTVWSSALNTTRSAKDFFFPQTENLMEFRTSGKTLEVIDTRSENEDFTVFGVRACDAASFDILDRVFLYQEPVDTYYRNRRAHGTVVTVACSRPAETCFCGTFGIDAAAPGGDVTVWDTGDDLCLRANTEKGERLLARCADLLTDTDDADAARAAEDLHKIMDRLPLADLTADGFGPGKTKELFDRPEWKTLSESCLGCGTCTFVCPTCQCYDIRDFDTGSGIQRFRCWDSCMYSDFTKMSAGQPRPTQTERFRQRFMHKLVYFPDNNDGTFGCVGCGRCLQKCPISMNIVKVIKTLGGKN